MIMMMMMMIMKEEIIKEGKKLIYEIKSLLGVT